MSINVDEWKIIDEYNSAYWSGNDISVYAEHIYLEEAFQLNFVVAERTHPVYNYAKYVANHIMHGVRIITGELSLNFKRDSFIYSLIQLLRNLNTVTPSVAEKYPNTKALQDPILWGPPTLTKLMELGASSAAVIAKLVAESNKSSTTVLNEDDVNRINPSINDFRGLFEVNREGFDLSILYGASLQSGLTMKANNDGYSYETNGAVYPLGRPFHPGTGLKLIGTSITGKSRSNTDDGRNIIETYTFMARDLQVITNKDLQSNSKNGIISALDFLRS